MATDLGPLDWRIPIVTKDGRPTAEFQRRWAIQRDDDTTVTIGSGPPSTPPIPTDGEIYIDGSTTPYSVYIANGGTWHIAGGSALEVQDEGTPVDAAVTSINFTGAGVTATQTSPGEVEVAIPGGGGSINGAGEVLISEVTPSGVGTVTFSGIPATFKDLRVVVRGRGAAVATSVGVGIRLNSDSGANYYRERDGGTGTTSNSAAVVGSTSADVGSIPAASATANKPGIIDLTLYDYLNTTFFKQWRGGDAFGTSNVAGGQSVNQWGGTWNNTAAVTAIDVILSSGNFAAGTTVSLYGKGGSGAAGTGITQLTGDVTAGPGNGSQAATIAANAVTTAKIIDDAVTYAKIQNVSVTDRILGRDTAGAGDIEELTLTQILDMIGSPAQGDILYRGAASWARLGAGTAKQHLMTGGASANPSWATVREVLTADRTYYVATTGSDSNDGLTVGTPFLTIQKALDVAGSVDTAVYNITIQLADGTYNARNDFKTIIGAGTVTILGNLVTPANVVVTSPTHCFVGLNPIGNYTLRGMRIDATNYGIIATGGGCQINFNTVDFAACNNYHIAPSGSCLIQATGSYSISGGGQGHIFCTFGGRFQMQTTLTVTLTGTPNWSVAFVTCNQSSVVASGSSFVTYSGAATGSRYNVSKVSIVDTSGGGATYLPGNAAGTADGTTGGYYT